MKIILLFFTISCGFILNAQQFFGLPTQNVSWIVNVYFTDITYYEPGYSIDYYGNIKYQTNGDTTINGNTFTKLYRTNPNLELTALYRNDTLNQQVKMYNLDSLSEYTIFDFSKTTGDTLFDIYLNQSYKTNLLIVKADSILINNVYHKRFKLKEITNYPTNYIFWIDGFGSVTSFYRSWYSKMISYNNDFVFQIPYCFTFNNQTYTTSPSNTILKDSIVATNSSCNFQPLSIKKNKQSNIKLYPNPATNYFSINYPVNAHNIIIYDAFGKTIVNQTLNKNTFNISAFNAGIYLVVLLNNEGTIIYKNKLIKQ